MRQMVGNGQRAGSKLLPAAAATVMVAAGLAGVAVAGPAVPATALSLTALRVGSVSPRAGAAGARVTITGSGFARVRAVRFGGVGAVFRVRSRSKITAVVPAMPSAAVPVTVTTRAGTARSRARFTVTPRVVASPVTGPPGTAVQVSGTGFGVAEGVDVFVDTADRALAGTGPAGSFGPVSVTIAASAAPGTHWVSAEGRRSRLFAQIPFTVSTDWAQFGFSASHDGANPFENVLSPSNVSRIGQAWSFATGNSITSSPAVAGGAAYVYSANGTLYAVNAATGARRWSVTIGRPMSFTFSSPAVAGGLVYVVSRNGALYALDAAIGARRWRFAGDNFVGSSPAVTGGLVYVVSRFGVLYALNAVTGARQWDRGGGDDFAFGSSPAVADGVVYTVTHAGTVSAWDAATGATRWQVATGDVIDSSPTVADGVVYIGTSLGVDALNAATGSRLRTFATGSSVSDAPAVTAGVIYIGADDGTVYALNAATGSKKWSFATGSPLDSFAAVAVANGVAYIGTRLSVHALKAANGSLLWTFLDGTGGDSPVVANGVVYIDANEGNLDAFDLAGGLAAPTRPNQSRLHPDHSLRFATRRIRAI